MGFFLFLSVLAYWSGYRDHPCLGLAAIFAGMLYNVQIIQKSSTGNIMHISIIVLELPAKLQVVVVLRSPIYVNEPSEYNGMLYRTSNRVLNNGIKVIILICMDGTSQYHHHQVRVGHWLNGLNGEYYGLRSRISEVDTLYSFIWRGCDLIINKRNGLTWHHAILHLQ